MDPGLNAVLQEASALAQRAGAVLLDWLARLDRGGMRRKSSGRDLVTAADLASEECILQGLSRAFPGDGVLAEESGARGGGRRVWCVDPLDGTTNFVHRLPCFAVSLARLSDGVPDVAVVHAPLLAETFTATRGGGAFCNRARLRVSETTALGDALLATGFPYRRQFLRDNNLENFNRLFLHVRDLRRMGSAALDLAYTAAGRFDAFWELHLQPYDVAAGGLMVTEAGGVADTLVPGGDWIHGRNILAGPAPLLLPIREQLLRGRPVDYPPLTEWDAPRP
ncbi:MAG: inositol monophosphatase [Planctomycetota bacterium]|nr:MAG: inositol monophosphatase [Planctomycetota bacterium]